MYCGAIIHPVKFEVKFKLGENLWKFEFRLKLEQKYLIIFPLPLIKKVKC